ncbi:MAG: protein-L-isoaspartate O-methyltransferase [Alphaproteobacteria bacterium]|nr:protein-L-isoaspartate O-methyltransferase [Alphaproteobacteria bacterium]
MTHFDILRKNMVNSQLLPNAITSKELLDAFRQLKRESFVPAAQQAMAYIDRDLKINTGAKNGEERFLLDPMVQAKLIQAAGVKPTDIVLDVACATGYSTALLAQLANMVVGIEANAKIAKLAARHIEQQEIDNAVIICDPLADGYKKEAPYDVIVINGLVEQVPQELFDQLAEDGRLIVVEVSDKSTISAPLGHAFLYHKTHNVVAKRMIFDASPTKLADFNKLVEFVL